MRERDRSIHTSPNTRTGEPSPHTHFGGGFGQPAAPLYTVILRGTENKHKIRRISSKRHGPRERSSKRYSCIAPNQHSTTTRQGGQPPFLRLASFSPPGRSDERGKKGGARSKPRFWQRKEPTTAPYESRARCGFRFFFSFCVSATPTRERLSPLFVPPHPRATLHHTRDATHTGGRAPSARDPKALGGCKATHAA